MMSAPANSFAIQINNAKVSYAERSALNNISLNITKGKWTSIIGPNGAGKSTLLRLCAGLQGDPDCVRLDGTFLSELSHAKRARHIAWLGQNETVQGEMSVYELVMLGRLPHLSWFDKPSEHDHLKVIQALESVHAAAWKERPIDELSGGERQRVFIARALAVDADILLMDEPLSSLDPPHQADCSELIRSLVARGKTVVTVLHEIAFALSADEIIVMQEGRVRFQGMVDQHETQRHVEQVFQNRIEIHSFKNRLIVLPV